jgi:two-component system chemotaxis response regulator CheB
MTVIPAQAAGRPPVRVMVVDDSAVIRGMLGRWLEAEPDLALVGAAGSAEEALRRLETCAVDVCVLDVEMPGMSGIEALPRLLAARPAMRVVMASALTTAGAAVSLRALDQGAADCLAKPSARDPEGAAIFRRELFSRLRALGAASSAAAATQAAQPARRPARLRPTPDLLAIGCSTGGPPALTRVLCAVAPWLRVPVAVVQHMPATFTPILARNLAAATGLDVREAEHEAPLAPRTVVIAPGGRHLRLERRRDRLVALLDDAPPVNFCRPSVDPLFESAAEACGERLAAVVLTGMGADGRDGARAVARRGGLVVAQDQATSVVWGMPGAVVEAGLADVVAPLDRIGDALAEVMNRSRPA